MNKLLILILLCPPLAALANTEAANSTESLRLSRSIEHESRFSNSSGDIQKQLEAAEKSINLPLTTTTRSSTRALTPQHADQLYWLNVFDTEVSTDYDLDGFYQRFTLSFQPEMESGYNDVYADIYLSYKGHTWDYLTSTGSHRIFGDEYNDVIHITTLLDYGYPAGYYDVLIELRDSHTDELLASIGPDTDGALNMLPLEDEYHDDYYFDYGVGVSYYAHGSGSVGFATLLVGGGLLGMRKIIKTMQF